MATEKRLIDANALDRVLEDFENRYRKSCFALSAKAISNVRQIVYAMKEVDAADVAEVMHGYCGYCNGASYTSKPFKVITQMGREREVQFNYCPNCGKKLKGRGNDGE